VNGTERSAANLKIMSSNRLNRVMRVRALYYSRSFTKGYRSWPSVADLDRQETTQSDDRGLTRAGTTRM
jgi:hypothetical protein